MLARRIRRGRATQPKNAKTTADAVVAGSISVAPATHPAGDAAGATTLEQGQNSAGK
jgi:hypothetical protein